MLLGSSSGTLLLFTLLLGQASAELQVRSTRLFVRLRSMTVPPEEKLGIIRRDGPVLRHGGTFDEQSISTSRKMLKNGGFSS